jgi:telomerase reverse transcriptase
MIPDLYSVYPNQHVEALKASPWPRLLMLLGKEGERIMLDLLVHCAIFRSVKAGKGNLYQLGGIPVSELEPLSREGDKERPLPLDTGKANVERRPSEISFVRSRMLYARAALNARGLVHFGLRHIRTSLPSFWEEYKAEFLRCSESLSHQGPHTCRGWPT